jgi:hypothetical protein
MQQVGVSLKKGIIGYFKIGLVYSMINTPAMIYYRYQQNNNLIQNQPDRIVIFGAHAIVAITVIPFWPILIIDQARMCFAT